MWNTYHGNDKIIKHKGINLMRWQLYDNCLYKIIRDSDY